MELGLSGIDIRLAGASFEIPREARTEIAELCSGPGPSVNDLRSTTVAKFTASNIQYSPLDYYYTSYTIVSHRKAGY